MFWGKSVGVLRLNRFELIHLASMLSMQSDISVNVAKSMILNGECPLILRRNFADGTQLCFRVMANRMLTPLSNDDSIIT